jgi:DNA polymerase-3 subunit alpha
MKPDRFHDIIATNALYRPGPLKGGMVDEYVDVKLGRKKPEYKHPVLKEVLEETNGVMVYQEQVMRILNRLGGIELAASYTVIKAISKKQKDKIDKNYEYFIAGAVKNGMSKQQAQEVWDLIIQFAGYGFNKSHSTAYALIAYMTAYLKAHYPVEFMASLLSGDIPGRNFKKKDSLVEHLEDCRRMNLTVVPPDVNRSEVDFAVEKGEILFGLSAVKGCGGGAGDAIVAERKKNGRFKDIFDFCHRLDSQTCSRATIETLIKAGAFDSMGARRNQLLKVVERAVQSGASAAADRKAGQKNLFGGGDEEEVAATSAEALPDVPELDQRELLQFEKEVLGFYLTAHPLAQHEQALGAYVTHTTADIPEVKQPRQEVVMGGMIASIKQAFIRNPKPGQPAKYANFDLEDTEGIIRCILWPDDFERFGPLVQADAIVVLRGAVDRRGGGDEANLIVNEVIPLGELDTKYVRGCKVTLHEGEEGESLLRQVREIVRTYPGRCELQLLLQLNDGRKVELKSNKITLDAANPEFRRRMEDLLGPKNFQLRASLPKPAQSSRGNGYGRRDGNGGWNKG